MMGMRFKQADGCYVWRLFEESPVNFCITKYKSFGGKFRHCFVLTFKVVL